MERTHSLKVGDILTSSWGYEQTNYDFYEVVALNGKSMVTLRKLARKSDETGWLRGTTVPVPGQYVGEPFRRKASASSYNEAYVSINSYAGAWKWDGKPENYTAYA